MTIYSRVSPYFNTSQNNLYLELISMRPVPAEPDDILYTIEPQYENRPDLLAFYLYGKASLWWVFVQRNMEVIKDPIYDFESGKQIYLPKKSNLERYLGV
jgi:hypothetical protein